MTPRPTRRRRLALALAAAGLALTQTTWADEGSPSTFSVQFENDLFADTDQNYTNGIKLSWMSPDLKQYIDDPRLPGWISPHLPALLLFDRHGDRDDPEVTRNVIVSIGQSIFTPEEIGRFDLITDDRPYGGWLYAGLGFRKREPNVLDTLELQLGVIGPFSGAEPAQVLVHELRGFRKPNGWRHQLDNEPVFGIAYERKWRAHAEGGQSGLGVDLIPHLGAALGSAYVFGSLGAEVRAGWNLPPDFGDPIIRPGGITSPPVVWDSRKSLRWYGFAFVDARAVGRDVFLDGNLFGDSHSVDKKPFVADLGVGVAVILGRFQATLTRVVRTREFDAQPDKHEFGSVSLSYSF